jgi:hypothetical protein
MTTHRKESVMAKIDYSKAEREMHEALQRMRVKDLAEGKSVTSQRASEYYGLEEQTPRPTPEEPVAKLLREEAAKEELLEKKLAEEKLHPIIEATPQEEGAEATITRKNEAFDEPLLSLEDEEEEEETTFEIIRRPPVYDVMRKVRTQSKRPPKAVASPTADVPPSDTFLEPASHLYILRQHILWLKRRHYDNRYEMLGTTRDEVMSFRHAKRLTDEQLARIKELNDRAEEVKASLLAEEGIKSDEQHIEQQKAKHKTKRFNVKESWLPL